MGQPKIDLTKFDEAIDILRKMSSHRKARPTTKSAELYYDLLLKHFQEIRQAVDEGKPLIPYSIGTPVQILRAMDVVPMQYEYIVASSMVAILGISEEVYRACSARQNELIKEIDKLISRKPCPLLSSDGWRIHLMRWAYEGREEGVNYYQTLLQEIKEKVEQGKGALPKERIRLMSLCTTPAPQGELYKWMEKEYGALVVAEPLYLRYGDWEIEPSKPLEAMVRLLFNHPYIWSYATIPNFIDLAVKDARESQVDAGVNWFNSKCRLCPFSAEIIKREVGRRAGIPVLNLETDMLDHRPVALEARKKALSGFFEGVKPEGNQSQNLISLSKL